MATVISIPLVYYFSPLYHLSKLYGTLESDLKHVFVTSFVAILGGLLFAFRGKSKGEVFELFEAMELLLLIVIPCVVAFEYILQDPSNYSIAVTIYLAGVAIWFPVVIIRHRSNLDPKKERAFTSIIVYIFAMLVTFGGFAYWQLATFSKFLSHPP